MATTATAATTPSTTRAPPSLAKSPKALPELQASLRRNQSPATASPAWPWATSAPRAQAFVTWSSATTSAVSIVKTM